jgi:hypothetical protein
MTTARNRTCVSFLLKTVCPHSLKARSAQCLAGAFAVPVALRGDLQPNLDCVGKEQDNYAHFSDSFRVRF